MAGNASSRMFQTGRQYWPVDSITISVTRQLISHVRNRFRSECPELLFFNKNRSVAHRRQHANTDALLVNVNATTTAVNSFHVVLSAAARRAAGTDLDNPTRVHRRRRDNNRYFRTKTSPAILTHGLISANALPTFDSLGDITILSRCALFILATARPEGSRNVVHRS